MRNKTSAAPTMKDVAAEADVLALEQVGDVEEQPHKLGEDGRQGRALDAPVELEDNWSRRCPESRRPGLPAPFVFVRILIIRAKRTLPDVRRHLQQDLFKHPQVLVGNADKHAFYVVLHPAQDLVLHRKGLVGQDELFVAPVVRQALPAQIAVALQVVDQAGHRGGLDLQKFLQVFGENVPRYPA